MIGLALLAVALLVFGASELALALNFGMTVDEVYSWWASAHDIPASTSVERLTGDTNPPIYYALLWLARWFTGDALTAFVVVNATAFVSVTTFTIWTSWRAKALSWALLGLAALAMRGSTLFFFQEGRGFFLGICLSFATAWQCALMISEPAAPRRVLWLSAFGVVGALTHFYIGLLVGCMAAGLVAYSVLGKRRDLLAPGLIVGLATTVATVAWSLYAADRVEGISWIVFTQQSLREAAWFLRDLILGPWFMVVPLVAILAYCSFLRNARPLLMTFAIAGVLFATIPLVISFIVPVVMGRYWAVGAAALTVLLVFLTRELLRDGATRSIVVALVVAAWFVATDRFGFLNAQRFQLVQPTWDGALVVASLARDCPAGSVHVRRFPELYATAANLRGAIFVSADGAPPLYARDATCPVLGWAEHYFRARPDTPETELLTVVGVQAAPGEVRVLRHRTGFVVVRADANPPAR